MKKIAIFAAAAMIFLGSRAGAMPSAPTITPNDAGVISVTGTLGAENANKWVSLTVYKTDAGTEGVSAQGTGNLNWYDQIMTNEKGDYAFSFKMNGDRGVDYSFSITTDEITAPEAKFVFYPETEMEVIKNLINSAKASGDAVAVKNVVLTYKDYLQLDMTEYSALPVDSEQLSVCENVLLCDVSDVKKFKQAFEDCAKVKVLNLETDALIYEEKMLEFLKADAAAASGYFEGYSQAEKTAVVATMMANDTFKKKSDMISCLNDIVLCDVATKARLWPEMHKLVLAMAPEFSVDLTAYNALSNAYGDNQSSALQLMLGKTYRNCAQIISVFNTAVASTPVPKAPVDGGGSSGGGGGGFGGGGGGAVMEMPTPVVPLDTFPDISGYGWAKDSIKKLFVRGVVSGDEKGNFNPSANVTRAQYIKMIISALDMSISGQNYSFDDVKPEDWYFEYVITAAESGLVSGIDASNFGPNLPITRQDAATMIKRAADIKGITLSAERGVDISDKREIADYAKEAVETLYACNLLNGVGDGRFAPRDNMTRAQAAVIISNFLDRLEGLK